MSTRDVAELAQTLFEEIGDAAFVADPATLQVTDANPVAERMTGLGRGELLARTLDQLFRADGGGGLGHLRRALHTTQTFHAQDGYFLRHGPAGGWTPVNLTLTRLHTEAGPLGLVLARDATDRVRAEDELRRANATLERRVQERTADLARANDHLRQEVADRERAAAELRDARAALAHVVGSSPAVLFTLLLDGGRPGEVGWASDNLHDLFGHDPAAAAAPGWWRDHTHPADRGGVEAALGGPLLADGRAAPEFRFRRGDGAYRWVRWDLRLARDAAGRPAEAVGSWSDVTARRELEDHLRQAQKMEALGQLAGGIAHDFNNVLTVISGYTGMAARALRPDDPTREMLREVAAAADRAAGLTRQLLQFGRRGPADPRPIDLRTVVAGVDLMLRRLLPETVTLSVLAEPGAGAVRADPGLVEQVLVNLVVNARDAMPAGGRVSVGVADVDLDAAYAAGHPDARPGPHVRLSVADTGAGMDPDTAARAFEPFFTTKGAGGTGLGLAIVHGVVRQAGGHVTVETAPGRGSTFRVYLPRADRPAPAAPTRSGLSALPRGTETVLLVEDEEAVRGLARHVLRVCGYTVLDAETGADALRLAADHPGRIDLLLSDVVLPGMGGGEVAEKLTAARPGVRVLFVSGYADDPAVRGRVHAAKAAFLPKPFTPGGLAVRVREVLDEPAPGG